MRQVHIWPRLVALLCGVGACAGPVVRPAPSPLMPALEVGERFRFSDGQQFRVGEITADRIVWVTADGGGQVSARDIFLPPIEGVEGRVRFNRVVTDRQGELWPPRPGNTALFRANLRRAGAEVRELWSCAIREAMILEIRLGKFDAYPVACDVLRGSGAGRETETQVSYYAPRLRYFARIERHDAAGRTTSADLTDVLTVDTSLAASALLRRDAAMQAALETVPSGRDIGWRDPDGATSGRVRPVRSFRVNDGRFCREFEEDTATAERFDRNRRIACRQAEGIWVEVEPTA